MPENIPPIHSVFDIADWFLAREPTTHRRLQKLVYYAQGWGLALLRRPLAVDENGAPISFEAWSAGPMSRELYRKYHMYLWEIIPSPSNFHCNFSRNELELLEEVYEVYAPYASPELESMSMAEDPWRNARRKTSVKPNQISRVQLDPNDMATYFLEQYQGDDYGQED
jgi:uncharacterized phage-associated protein